MCMEMVADVAGERKSSALDRIDGQTADGVEGIADQRMTGGSHVDADLVWAAGNEIDFDDRLISLQIGMEETAL